MSSLRIGSIAEELLSCKDYLDVTIVLDDGEIKSNKFVLAARSKYFANIFKNDEFQGSNGNVHVSCSKVIMEKVINLIYGGNLNCSTLPDEQKSELVRILLKLQHN